MADKKLEQFYGEWSCKAPEAIACEIKSAVRKADVIVDALPVHLLQDIRSIIDFGCGYGAVLHRFRERLKPAIGEWVGVDFSLPAIEVARHEFQDEWLKYYKLPGLDAVENMVFLESVVVGKVDCILLVDLLEHVPDCKALVTSLARFTRFFIVKLPVESSVLDNYILPKEYPSSLHSNGHLREFDANNVHYFIRQLGLTPLYESLYVYHLDDVFSPLPTGVPIKRRLVHWVICMIKGVASKTLPKKLFLRWVGGGGYFCLATFDSSNVLNP
jgi:SAM-dependent methyltransferase